MYNTAVLFGSVRTERKGDRIVKFIEQSLQKRNHQVSVVDPLIYNLPLLDKMFKEYPDGKAPANMQQISDLLNAADGFIMITAEYNHSIPPALKNLLDHFQKEYYFKPTAIVSYSAGMYGGVRAAIQLRAITAELGTPSIPGILGIPFISKSFTEQGIPEDDAYYRRTERFLDEYEWYLRAFKTEREKGMPY